MSEYHDSSDCSFSCGPITDTVRDEIESRAEELYMSGRLEEAWDDVLMKSVRRKADEAALEEKINCAEQSLQLDHELQADEACRIKRRCQQMRQNYLFQQRCINPCYPQPYMPLNGSCNYPDNNLQFASCSKVKRTCKQKLTRPTCMALTPKKKVCYSKCTKEAELEDKCEEQVQKFLKAQACRRAQARFCPSSLPTQPPCHFPISDPCLNIVPSDNRVITQCDESIRNNSGLNECPNEKLQAMKMHAQQAIEKMEKSAKELRARAEIINSLPCKK